MEPSELSLSFGRNERMRLLKDRLVRTLMAVGGISVIITILLIFVYLFYVVIPLFRAPSMEPDATRTVDLAGFTAPLSQLAIDEYGEVAFLVGGDGHWRFARVDDGVRLGEGRLVSGDLSALAEGDPDSRVLAAANADGEATFLRRDYAIDYPNNERRITPALAQPLGEQTLSIGFAPTHMAAQLGEDEATVVAAAPDQPLTLVHGALETSFLDDSLTVEQARYTIPYGGGPVRQLVLDVDQRELYVLDDRGVLHYFNVQRKNDIRLVDQATVVRTGETVSAMAMLPGGISLLIATDSGAISQWFPVRDDNNNYHLARVRGFQADAAVTALLPEHYRKAFATVDADNGLTLFHATASKRLVRHQLPFAPEVVAFGPRANTLVAVAADGRLEALAVHNEHPEVSFRALWREVWYESREGPEFIWQSSSASSDFEPKFSLTPLAFGTIKAAGYAMLFAMPLAIFGAIYTAYFMTPRMRQVVKPSIEVMEALPTVILGFLAGLWLAPLVEKNLPGVLMLALLLPGFALAASFVWLRMPASVRRRVPDGWEAALLIPVLIAAIATAFALSHPVEVAFFGGSLPRWLADRGIDYDQRNSLVVGIAMGFAVIPTIFSISEDAVFSVPKHLTTGSLALGATPWQTVTRVVLLTASPGIFSAVMIGLGRAVGETMIVLMATGNTPIMDANIFQGFRALSANIAVEMPESEVGSTHYRILFLAALVLFLATFAFNTLAETVRHRLRMKYSSL